MILYEHNGKTYTTEPASSCDKCEFYWRDGGIYDACCHPDEKLASNTCWKTHRDKGINVHWVVSNDN